MSNPESGPDPRRWMKNLPASPSKRVERPTKQTMMARISGFFRTERPPDPLQSSPSRPTAEPSSSEFSVNLPGDVTQQTFQVPRYRSPLVAGESIDSPPMEITIALQRLGARYSILFYWKDTDLPEEKRQKTDFVEDEEYVKMIYNLVIREPLAPRKLAEEIARARRNGNADSDGILKALVEMETKRGWQALYNYRGRP